MRIAVNTRLLLRDRLDGIGVFTNQSLRLLTQQNPEHQFFFLFDRPYDESFIYGPNVTPVVIGPQARHPFLFYWWFERSVKKALDKIKPDVFLSPDGYLPLRGNHKSVAVIHDLNFLHYPNDLPYLVSAYYNYFFPRFAKKASRIATVSSFSKSDLCRQFNVPAEKIDLVYNASGRQFSPVTEEEKRSTRARYSAGEEYFFFVGTILPRKNLFNLVRAFKRYKSETGGPEKLLLAGSVYHQGKQLKRLVQHLELDNDVIFCGRVSDEELKYLYGSALALTYVSYFEGFGIPILESFACGTPVIAADTTSIPEVAGDAALLVDPFSIESIKNGLTRIRNSVEKRQELVNKGFRQKDKFTWEKTAEKLWQSILLVAEDNVKEKP